jgi:hypothetical protein
MDFPVNSRYHDIETTILEREGQEPIVYLRRRFVPLNGTRFFLGTHPVSEGERLDHLAAKYLGDPELFWRLCDANSAMRPQDLTDEIGEGIKIPLVQER